MKKLTGPVLIQIIFTAFFACLAAAEEGPTATPIKHLVVIFQENVSFDHYFASYPRALNPREEETRFTALPDTPAVNGLTEELIRKNPNSVRPFRLGRDKAWTCSPGHGYTTEQRAYNGGRLDRFVESLGPSSIICNPGTVMGYYDGNTVTALWNYAQRFAMSDNFFGSTFGPSTPGALNLISGQTHGAEAPDETPDIVGGTVIGDPDPQLDDCAVRGHRIKMSGKNIGDLLNAKGVTWGWFQGGFRPTERAAGSDKAICGAYHLSGLRPIPDYLPHHEPFQYYESTANPHHYAPASAASVGRTDAANHQYDISDFWDALAAGNPPAVGFVKAPAYQDGHPGYSGPLSEQSFLVALINRLQKSRFWGEMAIIIAYDDSGGWYDHVMPEIQSPSKSPADALTGSGLCVKENPGFQGRCGFGPRLPLLVISPYARRNFVDHTRIDQTSILRFIEDNWALGRIGNGSFDEKAGTLDNLFDWKDPYDRMFLLDPVTGEVRSK